MVYIICLAFKAQRSHMCFFKEFKVSKTLCITTFDIICTYLTQNVYTIPWKHPKLWWYKFIYIIVQTHCEIKIHIPNIKLNFVTCHSPF